MAAALGRFPFVSKSDVILAYKPGVEPSESTFRTLRRHGYVSRGTDIRVHRHGRVSGQLRCYAALNLDAAVLARHGHVAEAEQLADEAELFEREWSSTLAELATDLDVGDFGDLVALRNQLAHGLGPAAAQLEEVRTRFRSLLDPAIQEQFVRISQIASPWATLDIIAPRLPDSPSRSHAKRVKALDITTAKLADPIRRQIAAVSRPAHDLVARLAVDTLLPLNAGLVVGDLALLRIEHAQGTSFVSLLAAVADAIEDEQLDAATAAYFSDEPLPSDLRTDIERRRSGGESVTVPERVVVLAS